MLVVVLAIIPMALLLVYNALEDRRSAQDQADHEAQAYLARHVAQQEQLIEGSRQIMASVAGLVAGGGEAGSFNPQACNNALRNLLRDLSFYANIGLATARGVVGCSALPVDGFPSVAESEWFKRVDASREFAVGTYEVDPVSNKTALTLGYPVLNDDGTIRLLIFLTLDPGWFVANNRSLDGQKNATFTLFDSTGRIVHREPDTQRSIGRLTPEAADFMAAFSKGSGASAMKGEDGVSRLYAFGPVGDPSVTGLYASVGIPESVAYAGVAGDLRRNLLVLAMIALAALVAVYFASDLLIVRPVKSLVGLAGRLAAGDLGARTPLTRQRGELGTLARALNAMSERLELRDRQREQTEIALREAYAKEAQDRQDERERISMDLHDGVIQDIFAVSLGLELAADEVDERQRRGLERSIDSLHGILRNIRSYIFDLRPRHFTGDLGLALAELGREFNQYAQINTRIDVAADLPSLPEEQAMAFYHVAHEALSNARKHANASIVSISLTARDDSVVMEIRDDGQGFDPSLQTTEEHRGIRNMASRAAAIGARLDIVSAPGQGTTLQLVMTQLETALRPAV
jgi:signal transduction histidine kinase